MRANSLWFRLIVSSAVIAIVLLTSAAVLLNAIFVQALELNFDQRLKAALDGVLTMVELGPDNKPKTTGQLADTRFNLPFSGWYWQISTPGLDDKLASSLSLLEQHLTPAAAALQMRDKDGIAAFSMRDRQGTNLRVIQQDVKLFNTQNTYSFLITGNFDELKSVITSFQHTLLAMLGALGLALLAAVFFQVRFTLKPLREMQHQLNDIRSGKAELLAGNFPRELQPVADELNLLVQSNFEIVDRARMQVDNLAHALKTPISVITNEVRESKTALAQKLREQINVMRDQVNLYLDRARRAARAQSIGGATDVEPVLQALGRTLQRINVDRKLTIEVDVPTGLRFRGERQDLEEMVGNLLDNACKWAKSHIVVRAQALVAPGNDGRLWLLITVDDDGPGIAPEKRDMALERGKRLDESKPGSGLGLSIVAETASMYSGVVSLDRADLGGLRANLRLPRLA